MSTRALVRVKDANEEVVVLLYSPSDSYPTGLGRDIMEFVGKHPIADQGVRDYAMQLQLGNLGLEAIRIWDDRAIDWCYDLIIANTGRVEIVAREVDWTERKDGPQLERLCEPIELAAVIARKDAEAEAYRRHMDELRESISNCPFCGLKGSPEHIPGGVRIKCLRYACRPRLPEEIFPDLETAVAAWNRFVAQCDGSRSEQS